MFLCIYNLTIIQEPEESEEGGAGGEGEGGGEGDEYDGAADDVTAAEAETTETASQDYDG